MKAAYLALEKPFFAPPPWLFAPVWTALYIMMGIAVYRIFRQGWKKPENKQALILFAVQLFFNVIWTQLFFGWQMRGLALIDILLLLGVLVPVTIRFYKLDRVAGWLLVPYVLWTAFAAVLNASVWYLNR